MTENVGYCVVKRPWQKANDCIHYSVGHYWVYDMMVEWEAVVYIWEKISFLLAINKSENIFAHCQASMDFV